MKLAVLCLLSLLLFLPAHAFYYVRQSNPSDSPDGSLDNPFINLNQAIDTLGTGNFEIVLLGDKVTLVSDLILLTGSNIIIRANDEKIQEGSYFPLELKAETSILVSEARLTLKNIQIVELDEARSFDTSAFNLVTASLTLEKVLISDISYLGTGYALISAYTTESNSELTILNSDFRNLADVMMFVSSMKLTISDTTFSGIELTSGLFLVLDDSSNLITHTDILLQNINAENINIRYNENADEPTTFIGLYMSAANIVMNGWSLKNINVEGGAFFVQVLNAAENTNAPTSFSIQDLTIENFSEITTDISTINTGSGIIFDLFGATSLNVANLLATNVQLQYKAMLVYAPNIPANSKILKPAVTATNIKIQGSKNANSLFSSLENLFLQDIDLQNNSFDPIANFPLFSMIAVTNVYVRNVFSLSNHGPVFRSVQGPNQQFENCTFDKPTSSQLFPSGFQYLVSISRKSTDTKVVATKQRLTLFKNFNIYGYTDIDGLDITKTSNDTYAILALSEVGEVIIQDSRWSNMEMGGVLSTAIVSLKVDGLTVDADDSIPQTEIPWHRLFQLVNLGRIDIKNSNFINNKNINILNLYNIRRGALYDSVALPSINFDNVRITNNDIVSADVHKRFLGLIAITTPFKPVQFSLTNSYIANNKINNGIIFAQESSRVDLTLMNNVFEDNVAKDSGAVLSVRDIQEDYSHFVITANKFDRNTCAKNGGVFSILSAKLIVDSRDNTYFDNSAGRSGGVGYAIKTKTLYTEVNGLYSGNQAEVSGGSWLFNVGQYEKGSVIPLNFEKTIFEESRSYQNGGALFITSGSLNVNDCVFMANRATVSGGDIYLVASSAVNIKGTSFKRSYAASGSILFAETITMQSIVIEDSSITDIPSRSQDSVVFKANSGSFKLLNTKFCSISGALFDLDGSAIEIVDSTFGNINCAKARSFCFLQGSSVSLSIVNSKIRNILSIRDLFVLNSPKDVSFTKVLVKTVRQSKTQIVDRQLFVVRSSSAKNILIDQTHFHNLLDFSAINSTKGTITITDSKFTRTTSTYPANLPNTRVAQKVQFLLLDSATATIERNQFTVEGLIKNSLTGGAIGIKGTGGVYNIINNHFDGNQALRGGAINVAGTRITRLNIIGSEFENNIADSNGGAIYFAPTSMVNRASIDACTFESNKAARGGAIFVNILRTTITNSIFNQNSAKQDPAVAKAPVGALDLTSNTFVDNIVLV